MELNETEFEYEQIEHQTEVMADQVNWAVEDCILVGLASQVGTALNVSLVLAVDIGNNGLVFPLIADSS